MPKADPAKEQHWRAVIADSDASGLSRAEYCRQHDINNIQLRNWINRLKQRDNLSAKAELVKRREAARAGQKITGKKPRLVPKVNTTAQTRTANDVEQSAAFAEVRLIQPREREELTAPQLNNSSSMEIVFNSGTRLRLMPGCPVDLLSSVIALLEDR